jgi:hypothetical protein
MTAAFYTEQQSIFASEIDRRNYILDIFRLDDHRRTSVDHCIPDRPRSVVSVIAGE